MAGHLGQIMETRGPDTRFILRLVGDNFEACCEFVYGRSTVFMRESIETDIPETTSMWTQDCALTTVVLVLDEYLNSGSRGYDVAIARAIGGDWNAATLGILFQV